MNLDVMNKCTSHVCSLFPFFLAFLFLDNISNRETVQLRRTSRMSLLFKRAAYVFLTSQSAADRAYR